MNYEKMVLAIEAAPENVWTGIALNIYIFKTGSSVAQLYPNISNSGFVSEWQSNCYRLDSNVRVEGRTFKGSDKEDIMKKLEEEIRFLNSITIPYRD
jgi:hypothetical protein